MNEQPSTSPRRRLQELLAIPERRRTDAEWDEINELEIALASANRADKQPDVRRSAPAPNAPAKPRGGAQGKSRSRKTARSRPKAVP